MIDRLATVDEALNSAWKVIDSGAEIDGFRPEDISIFTVSGKEVIGCSEWLRAEKSVLEHIVELHNQGLESHRNRNHAD
jgi:hypothetical protein